MKRYFHLKILAIVFVILTAAAVTVFLEIAIGDGREGSSNAVYRALKPARQSASSGRVGYVESGYTNGQADISSGDTGQSEASESILERSVAEYYDVPLDNGLQDYIFELCDTYEIDPVIVIAMIGKESEYNAAAIGDSGHAFGLMQVQPRWHEGRIEDLGVTDLLDPYQNVLVGIDYLAELFDRGNSLEWTLMAYNGGFDHAYRHIERGTVSTYVTDVLVTSEELGG